MLLTFGKGGEWHCYARNLKLFLDSLNVFNLQVNEKNQGLISLKNTFEECNETLNVNQNQELMTQVLDCFNTLKDNNQVLLSSLFNLLGIKYNFHHKKYGYPNFKAFIKDLDKFSLVFEIMFFEYTKKRNFLYPRL